MAGVKKPKDHTYIMANVRKDKRTDCWLWTGTIMKEGYANVGGGVLGHRLAYELFKGPIPEGLLIDHRKGCPRHCVNPDHLQAVTRSANHYLDYIRRRGQLPPQMWRIGVWLHEEVTHRLGGYSHGSV